MQFTWLHPGQPSVKGGIVGSGDKPQNSTEHRVYFRVRERGYAIFMFDDAELSADAVARDLET